MKKITYISILLLLTGCFKPQAKETPISEIMSDIKANIEISMAVEENLKEQKSAEKYGLSSDIIKEGIAYYSTDENSSDKIIMVRAASDDDVENIENALSNHMTATKSAWKNNENESKKTENGLLKTKDDCILLSISSKNDIIEEIFVKNL